MLTAPLRSRFGINLRFDYYSADEVMEIVQRSAGLLDIPIESDGASEIAARSRGTPRIANQLLKHVRDYAQVRAGGTITREVADAALTMIDIDRDGLDDMDKRLLEAIIYKFDGGPVGLNSLGVAVGEEASTIEEVNEPFLIMQGFIKRTPRGREALPSAYTKVGAPPPRRSSTGHPELPL
jgi:Holliday junction DNA helicase RuvB